MHLTDDLRKSAESKLLPFRSPAPAQQGANPAAAGAPGIPFDLQLGPDQVPHDVAALRRPRASDFDGGFESTPRIEEQEALAHDARNLMTSLELFAGLLSQPGVLPDAHRHFAADLQSLAAPLSSLIERMANAARPQGGHGIEPGRVVGPVSGKRFKGDPRFVLEPVRPILGAARTKASVLPGSEPNDAGLMVKSCERLLAAVAGPSVALHISYERELGVLSLDGEALTRVLINLVKNASEAMPGGGRVGITVRKALGARPCALISVQDSGPGIPAHAMGQIFQAGFSSKKSRSRWPATSHHGLGLTIVRDLVEDAGGSVRVASTLKKGTTFEIKLPCRKI